MLRGPAGVPAERPFAGRFGVQADRLAHMRRSPRVGEILVVDPFQAMAGDVPAGLAHGGDDLRIALKRGRHAENGDWNIARGEQPPQPPEAGARAVFEHGFHVHVALAGPGLGAEHVGEKSLGGVVAVQDAVLAALLEIDHELQRHASAARPARIGRIAAVTGEIARVIGWGRRTIAFFLQKRPGRPTMAEAWPPAFKSLRMRLTAMLSRHAIDRVRAMPPLRAASSWE